MAKLPTDAEEKKQVILQMLDDELCKFSLHGWVNGGVRKPPLPRSLAITDYTNKLIYFTFWALKYFETTEGVLDAIRHEIAHVIHYKLQGNNWTERGHGKNWKNVCKQIGAIPAAVSQLR